MPKYVSQKEDHDLHDEKIDSSHESSQEIVSDEPSPKNRSLRSSLKALRSKNVSLYLILMIMTYFMVTTISKTLIQSLEELEELLAIIIKDPYKFVVFTPTVFVFLATLVAMISQLRSADKRERKEKEIVRQLKEKTREYDFIGEEEREILSGKIKILELENANLKESIEQNVTKLDTLQKKGSDIPVEFKNTLSDFFLLLKKQQDTLSISLERQRRIEEEQKKVKLYREAYARQLEILNDYYNSGLRQSERSFNFAIAAAVFGFFIIEISVLKPIFFVDKSNIDKIETIIQAGTGAIISAFSGIFFALSNQTKRDMINFSDKIRVDRKLNESLKLIETIEDTEVRSKIQSIVGLSFSGISISEETILSLFFKKGVINSKENSDG